MYGLMMNCGPACGCGPRQGRWGQERERMRQMWNSPQAQRPWVPPIDITEDAQAFYLTADLPGVAREDIQLELDDRRLIFKAQRPAPAGEGNLLWQGRRYGSFERGFKLPRVVDQEAIAAEYRDGVLRVTLPKSAASVVQQVAVN